MSYIDYLNESQRSPAQELEELKAANGFGDAELAINRAGRIAPGQMPTLLEPVLEPVVKTWLVLTAWLVLIVGIGAVISAGVHATRLPRGLTPMAYLKLFVIYRGLYIATFLRMFAAFMLMTWSGALVVALLRMTVNVIDLVRDMVSGRAAMIEGPVYATEEEHPGTPWTALKEQWTRIRQDRPRTYGYAIREVTVEVGEDGFRAIASGQPHRLYYTPRSKLLLSIEPWNSARR